MHSHNFYLILTLVILLYYFNGRHTSSADAVQSRTYSVYYGTFQRIPPCTLQLAEETGVARLHVSCGHEAHILRTNN